MTGTDACWSQPRPAQLRDRAMDIFWILIAVLIVLVAMVLLSYVVEVRRFAPKRPETLVVAPRIPIEYVDLGGMRVRSIRTGVGPNLVSCIRSEPSSIYSRKSFRSSRSASRS